jgi:hypothetical protein
MPVPRPRRLTGSAGRRVAVALGLLGILVTACAPLPPPPTTPPPTPPPTTPPAMTPPGALPAGLPDRLGIGLAASTDDLAPSGWVASTGVPFDYAYQYLAGGVNTGGGWQTWNANAQFPLLYAQAAKARGAIPVLTYYMLLQSTGPCGSCGEARQDLTNLNTTALMAAYYQDFTTLLQRLGSTTVGGLAGYGGTVIVQVEPDLSGYAEQAVLDPADNCYGYCTGTGNDPNLLRASVASSGNADVAAYPNTWRGFNLALLHLRDRYAPNVELGFHVSNWSTGPDIGSDPSAALNGTTQGDLAGSFAAASGVTSAPAGTSTYNLVFNDVANRDAGYAKYVLGQSNAFWDQRNVTLPDFTRWEQYLSAVTSTTGRRAIVWQVPLGNQWSRSENNTPGHYQDNKAEYFFAHPNELTTVGAIAVLYGQATTGSTTNTDADHDGITNPSSFCTTDGLSTGTACNTHVATVSDDDGGYLRTAAAAYYVAPLPLG